MVRQPIAVIVASVARHISPKPHVASPRSRGGTARLVMVLICLAGGLVAGCGGAASQQALTAQALAQKQASRPNPEFQKQSLVQAPQASLVNYKDYKVGPEDLLVVEIYGQEKLNREVRVNGQGEITMPMVGVVKVGGLSPQEIEKRLMELYDARFLVNPQLTVGVKEYRHQRVAVTGAVDKPGSYEIIGPRTLLEVLSLAGGFSSAPKSAAGDTINVIRQQRAPDPAGAGKGVAGARPFAPKTETVVIDLRRLVSGQEPRLNIPVHNGDVIHVPFAGTAYVLGGVKKPGNIPVKENLTVTQAVAMAGGVDPLLGTNNITIMRFDDQGKPVSINTSLSSIIARKDADLPLKDSDVVVVNESKMKKSLYIIRTLLPIPSGSYSMSAL
jgi:polysaccharide biosynthesis/export protein